MRIDIITIFPEMFESPLNFSFLKRAQEKGLLKIFLHDLRNFTHNSHRQVDDLPYGGGSGMVMKPEPFFEAVLTVVGCALEDLKKVARVILLSPQGETLNQDKIKELSQENQLILLCGRYEGIDERVREHLATDEISIGDYILGGGELPAMVLVDALSRLIPGVLGDERSLKEESFALGLLEYPHYTRPQIYRQWKVPGVLLSGDHKKIAVWRRQKALEKTLKRRPDLLKKAPLNSEDREILAKLRSQLKS